jgi:hypothetical protein
VNYNICHPEFNERGTKVKSIERKQMSSEPITYLVNLAILGYLRGIRIGAAIYNLVHTLSGPIVLVAYAFLAKATWLLPYGLIWISHIELDRLLGFGLKYPTRFNDTHLQRTAASNNERQ